MVTELLPSDLAIIVDSFWGGLLFCGSLLGLLVLLLPKADWRWRHWLLLGGGCGIFAFLVLATPTEQRMALRLAAVPFLGAGLSVLFDTDARERVPLGLALIVIGWFFAAWSLSYQGIRFLILLAPPFAVADRRANTKFHCPTTRICLFRLASVSIGSADWRNGIPMTVFSLIRLGGCTSAYGLESTEPETGIASLRPGSFQIRKAKTNQWQSLNYEYFMGFSRFFSHSAINILLVPPVNG